MVNGKALYTIAFICGIFPMVPAVAEMQACPESIEVQETLKAPAPEGWAPKSLPSTRYLVGLTFFDGDPDQQASLTPTQDMTSRKGGTAIWTFLKSDVPVWLACRYANSGTMFTKPLPLSYTQCRVTYGAGGIVKAIECK